MKLQDINLLHDIFQRWELSYFGGVWKWELCPPFCFGEFCYICRLYF